VRAGGRPLQLEPRENQVSFDDEKLESDGNDEKSMNEGVDRRLKMMARSPLTQQNIVST